MTKLALTLQVLRSVERQWAEYARQHEEKAFTARAELTKAHHWREHWYYQGRADSVRHCLEMLGDAGVLEDPAEHEAYLRLQDEDVRAGR